MEELAQAFVMQPSLIASKIMEANATPAEGQIAFAAVQADGSLEYNCTANGLGFWYDKAGNAIGWGDDSYVYSEFNKDTFTFTIGQFPDHCTAGDTYTIGLHPERHAIHCYLRIQYTNFIKKSNAETQRRRGYSREGKRTQSQTTLSLRFCLK